MSWMDFKKTKNPQIEVSEIRRRDVLVKIPPSRVMVLLEEEARRMYPAAGELELFHTHEVGIASTNPITEVEAVFRFREDI